MELVLQELAAGDLLPGRIYLCGGGSRLPQIPEALGEAGFVGRLPFARPPMVEIIEPSQVEPIQDATELLVDQQDVTPMALAYQAIEMAYEEAPLDLALRRVLRAMKV
jgi:cell division protein FtsA